MRLERTILSNLTLNEQYSRKVLPFLSEDYFSDKTDKVVFNLVHKYMMEYNALPSKEALCIDASNLDTLNESQFKDVTEAIGSLEVDKSTKVEWLVDQTEQFCQERAIFNAIHSSIEILDNKSKLQKGAIPKLLQDALAVSFDTSIGHDYLEDWEKRYDFYHTKEQKVAFDLDIFNKITNGGLPNKTLNVAMSGTGVGKTRLMCHCATANIRDGKNVLYITLEMAEERISERIDANLLDIPMDELSVLPKETFKTKVERAKEKAPGKLIVKEYPTASAGAANFRHLLNELKIKKNFKPDIIYIDYINLCVSNRLKMGNNVNSYSYIKSVAEELRGLAVEFNVPIFSATQTNRAGSVSTDPGLEDTSESFGLPATVDFMIALTTTEELDQLGQIAVKQLKNRYNDPSFFRRFVIGLDKQKMRLYDVSNPTEGITDVPIMDKNFGPEETKKKGKKDKFAEWF